MYADHPPKGKAIRPQLGSGDPVDAFQIEIKEVLGSVERGQPPTFLAANSPRDAIVLCQKQTESVRGRCRIEI